MSGEGKGGQGGNGREESVYNAIKIEKREPNLKEVEGKFEEKGRRMNKRQQKAT